MIFRDYFDIVNVEESPDVKVQLDRVNGEDLKNYKDAPSDSQN